MLGLRLASKLSQSPWELLLDLPFHLGFPSDFKWPSGLLLDLRWLLASQLELEQGLASRVELRLLLELLLVSCPASVRPTPVLRRPRMVAQCVTHWPQRRLGGKF